MRKLAFSKSVEERSEENVKSDLPKSYSAEDKAIEKLLGDVGQSCHEKTRYRKDKKGCPKLKS